MAVDTSYRSSSISLTIPREWYWFVASVIWGFLASLSFGRVFQPSYLDYCPALQAANVALTITFLLQSGIAILLGVHYYHVRKLPLQLYPTVAAEASWTGRLCRIFPLVVQFAQLANLLILIVYFTLSVFSCNNYPNSDQCTDLKVQLAAGEIKSEPTLWFISVCVFKGYALLIDASLSLGFFFMTMILAFFAQSTMNELPLLYTPENKKMCSMCFIFGPS